MASSNEFHGGGVHSVHNTLLGAQSQEFHGLLKLHLCLSKLGTLGKSLNFYKP